MEEARPRRTPLTVAAWLSLFGILGIVFILVWPDSYQQDGGFHYLFARRAWEHPSLFVGVWSRPLFTFVYAFPALAGYAAAKLLTVAISLAAGWQTWRLAEEFGLKRATLAVPFLLLQPCVLLLLSETMTEPVFALLFAIALRLHHRGRVYAGMVVASLLVLARPEGAFIAAAWAVWVVLDTRRPRSWMRRLVEPALLGCGVFLWWLAALIITGDPLWIRHDWPPQWNATGAIYGQGSVLTYVKLLPQIAGYLTILPFVAGLAYCLQKRRLGTSASAFLVILLVHSALWALGMFGAAGYARYFVCVAPAVALLTLEGWNLIADRLGRWERWVAVAVLALSLARGVVYVDRQWWSRDAWAVDEMAAWWKEHPRPVTRSIWSQAYMGAVLDADPWERPTLTDSRDTNMAMLRSMPTGTLVFWDDDTGPSWFRLEAADVESAGYVLLRSKRHELKSVLPAWRWLGLDSNTRPQAMHLLYKR